MIVKITVPAGQRGSGIAGLVPHGPPPVLVLVISISISISIGIILGSHWNNYGFMLGSFWRRFDPI